MEQVILPEVLSLVEGRTDTHACMEGVVGAAATPV